MWLSRLHVDKLEDRDCSSIPLDLEVRVGVAGIR
jgi:hypothetical protein